MQLSQQWRKPGNNFHSLSSVSRREDLRQLEVMEGIVQVKENINEEININREEYKGIQFHIFLIIFHVLCIYDGNTCHIVLLC